MHLIPISLICLKKQKVKNLIKQQKSTQSFYNKLGGNSHGTEVDTLTDAADWNQHSTPDREPGGCRRVSVRLWT